MVAHVTATAIPPHSRDRGIAATNARLIAQLARSHFVPSVTVSTSLLHHGVDPDSVIIVGTPATDNLRWILRNKPGRSQFCTARRKVLVVLRQSEDVTRSFDILTRAMTRLARDADVEIVVPLQHRLVVRSIIEGRLGSSPRVRLAGDLDYRDYVATMQSADIVLTDSSAVRCEAQTLQRPCVTIVEDFLDGLREDADGDLTNRVDEVFAASRKLLDDDDHYAFAARRHDAGLGGIAANSMELQLRAAVATRAPRGREPRQSLRATNAENHRGRVT
ncbi:MAG: UDP-N-acetyl glucosamine 2-epimerase [Acidobacteria bacterium]|nr:UDP-N-acetyl glucosamine 2-epimerase [Acidobacteriota bacterium]